MPQSRVFTFTDPDSYQEAIRGGQTQILTLGRGKFQAELVHIDLDPLWLQWGSDSLPRIARTTLDPGRTIVTFLADAEQGAMQIAGTDMANDNFVAYGRGSTNIGRTEGPSRWCAMSLAHADLAAAGEAIAGQEFTGPSDTCFARRPTEQLAHVRRLHAQAVGLARTAPETLVAPAVARALKQELTHAMIALLSAADTAERRWLPGQHARIVNRFQEFLEARPNDAVYLTEICTAIGVSERTLRTCCQEVLGVGPVRFLWLRRMHLARQGLLHANASTATVTEIATMHGFWELGRFSVEYRNLFGESPSTSLHHARQGS